MTDTEGATGAEDDERELPGRRRLVVGLVAAVVVTAAVATLLTGLNFPEAALVCGLLAAAVALAPAFLWLPLGADLSTDRPGLLAGLGVAWLAAAVAGPTAAFLFGAGLVSNATLMAASGGAYLLGLTLVGLAAGSLPTYRRLNDAAGPAPADAGPGPVAVGGRIDPVADGPFEATFTGTDCVCLEARATEQSDVEPQGEDLLLEERRTAPFDLVGSAGRVRVDPEAAGLRLRRDLQADVTGEEVTDRAAAALEAAGVDPRPDRRRTLVEHRLEPGDTATVLGTARRPDGNDRLVVDAGDIVVEDEDLAGTLRAYRLALLRGGGTGLVLTVAGLAGLFVAL